MYKYKSTGWFTKVITILVLLFFLAPLIVIVFASFSPSALVTFPPQGFSLMWYKNIFDSSTNFMGGLKNSLIIAFLATFVDIIVGVPAAIAITRNDFKGKDAIASFFASPMYVPSITFSFVLLQMFAMMGRVPASLKIFVGHLIIILPYIIRNTYSILSNFNWTLEEASASLGANPVYTIVKVTLPLIKPGIISGALLSFLYSFDEAVLSSMLNSPKFITLPVRIMNYMEFAFDPTLAAISSVLIVFSLLLILLMEKFVGLNMFLK